MSSALGELRQQVLVVRCQSGDADAFEELLRNHQPGLRMYVRKMLGGSDPARGGPDVDDVLQDVWTSAFKGIRRLKQPAVFTPWLYRIARNRVYLVFRRQGREPRPEPAADLTEIIDDDSGPTFSAEDAAAIHAAIDRLSPDHREVILLRFVMELAYEQIAVVTGQPVGTVRSRLYHARIHLKQLLERMSPHEREPTRPSAAEL